MVRSMQSAFYNTITNIITGEPGEPLIFDYLLLLNLWNFNFQIISFSRQAAVLDSDEEDSAEVLNSSSWQGQSALFGLDSALSGSRISLFKEDDDLPSNDNANDDGSGSGGPTTPGGGPELPPLPGFKARLVEGILRSDFVAKMAESEWVKKNITSKNITLQLQLHSIKGTLSLNFPTAPSDRIW